MSNIQQSNDSNSPSRMTEEALSRRILDVRFHLYDTKYDVKETIGTGAYGVVCAAVNKKTNQRVAIKKIPQPFRDQRMTTRCLREIRILHHFRHENVIGVKDLLLMKAPDSGEPDLYVVLDLMESDLHKIIQSSQPLTDEHIRYFTYQLFRALKCLHSAQVIHRDLKPSNLLVNANCDLKIGDFGLARGVAHLGTSANQLFLTQYVMTRWYRAPELILSVLDYTDAVDIWSAGCIVAEMLNRKALFPGKDHVGQLKLIFSVLGTPKKELIQAIKSDLVKRFIVGLGRIEPTPLYRLFPEAHMQAVDLLEKMLQLDPRMRITAEQALAHPYLSKYHQMRDEPTAPPYQFPVDDQGEMTLNQLREELEQEVAMFHQRPTVDPARMRIRTLTGPPSSPTAASAATTSGTISDMTKTRIKQLLGASQRTTEWTTPAPAAAAATVTRKKKKKKRLNHEGQLFVGGVKPAGITDEDKRLLERWGKMQQNEGTDHEVPPSVSPPAALSSDHSLDGLTVMLSSTSLEVQHGAAISSKFSMQQSQPNSAQILEDLLHMHNVSPNDLAQLERELGIENADWSSDVQQLSQADLSTSFVVIPSTSSTPSPTPS